MWLFKLNFDFVILLDFVLRSDFELLGIFYSFFITVDNLELKFGTSKFTIAITDNDINPEISGLNLFRVFGETTINNLMALHLVGLIMFLFKESVGVEVFSTILFIFLTHTMKEIQRFLPMFSCIDVILQSLYRTPK